VIFHPRTLPAGAVRVDLAELLARLRQDRTTQARAIGPEGNPEALAATLPEDQIQGLIQELGGRVRVIDDADIDL